MHSMLTTNTSKQKAAADAGRVHQARQRRMQRMQARTKNLKIVIPPNHFGTIRAVSTFADGVDDPDVPEIHPALGRWPENSAPNIFWDLSHPETWIYKRPFTEEEMESSPFCPTQEHMIIAFCYDHEWTWSIKPRPGYDFITLRCFQQAMATCLQDTVSRDLWNSAGVWKKYDIALAFFRRTGNLPPIPSIDVFAGWKIYLTCHANNPVAVQTILGQMTEYVTCGANEGETRLQSVDLLGANCMFAGLTYLKESNYWVMSTTTRHIANMAHHMLPRPTGVPFNSPTPMAFVPYYGAYIRRT